jgi:hypothetical protein
MDPARYPTWGSTVYLPPNATFQFKFLRKESNGNVRILFFRHLTASFRFRTLIVDTLDGQIVWESDPNREATTALSGLQEIDAVWR